MGPNFLGLLQTNSLSNLSARSAQRLSRLGHSSDSSRLRISSGGGIVILLFLSEFFALKFSFWSFMTKTGARFFPRHAYLSCILCIPYIISSHSLRLLQLQQILQQYACEFLPAERKILALNNHNIDRTSQVARFSISGGKYDTVPHNTRTPLETIKKPDIYRKCALHLRSRYARSFLTFCMRLIHQETETFCMSQFAHWFTFIIVNVTAFPFLKNQIHPTGRVYCGIRILMCSNKNIHTRIWW